MRRWFLVMVVGLILLGCATKQSYVEINDIIIEVEVLKISEERKKGLMYRDKLGENKGMFFIFEEEGRKSFWMKNTLIPLDIIFINSDKEIVDITTMQPCESDLCESYVSIEPALYVLEVNAGFSDNFNISKGNKININLT